MTDSVFAEFFQIQVSLLIAGAFTPVLSSKTQILLSLYDPSTFGSHMPPNEEKIELYSFACS